MKTFDVAVIGLGAMGSAALFDLARQGHRVIGIEQFEPGHGQSAQAARRPAVDRRMLRVQHDRAAVVHRLHRVYDFRLEVPRELQDDYRVDRIWGLLARRAFNNQAALRHLM